jgi:glycerol-3-phosphate dehydrogenase
MKREDAVRSLLSEAFDIAVIGGGITGVGVALDAASRGYSVALVERADYASGTSSRSSKLVHGGLRYLQNFDLGLVREALLERQLMVRLAPHLVHPLGIVIPAFDGARPDRITGIGLNMYDVMSGSSLRGRRGRRLVPRGPAEAPEDGEWSPDRHRIIGAEEVLELLPALSPRNPTGGYLFYDCQTDDVRLVLSVLREAERFGTVAANRIQALSLAPEGILCRDLESGESFGLRADTVINATGVWADEIRPGELASEAEVPQIRPSRGTHILLRSEDLPLVSGAIVPAGENRTIFALPWLGMSLIGTTDNNYSGPLDHVQPASDDVDYLLEAVNSFFACALRREDVQGAFAGVRPLISSGDSRKSVDISRKAELYETSSGMITITGGKLTTWRRMAKMAVDAVVERDGRYAPCRTDRIPIGQPVEASRLTRVAGVPESSYAHLAGRYGHRAEQVLALAADRRELARPILRGHPDLLAEAAFAATEEQARSVGDVLLRRTRLGLLAARALSDARAPEPGRIAEVIGAELGWDRLQVATAISAFAEEAAAEGVALAGELTRR